MLNAIPITILFTILLQNISGNENVEGRNKVSRKSPTADIIEGSGKFKEDEEIIEEQNYSELHSQANNDVPSLNCPPSWLWFRQHCYKLFGEMAENQTNSQAKCQRKGANLISIESQSENTFLEKLFHQALEDGTLQESLNIWLGANRTNNWSPFVWVSRSELIFTDWGKGEPGGMGTGLCLEAIRKKFNWFIFQSSFSWQAKQCNKKNAYVCEMDEPSPIDGNWSDWMPSSCSATCGEGTQVLTRICNNPVPRYGGQDCTGNSTKYEDCKIKECPIHGGWSDWVTFSKCSQTCGPGVQEIIRTCNNPPPLHGGQYCQGISKSKQNCFTNCPIDGGWSDWIPSKCSKRCGDGSQIVTRTCTNPVPLHRGSNCTGNFTDVRPCKNEECKMDLVTEPEEQIPEFLLSCTTDYWIIDCDEIKFSYLMMIDQSGNFIEESDTGVELISLEAAVEKTIVTSDDWSKIPQDPKYLLKLVYNKESKAYFLKTRSDKYVAVQEGSTTKIILQDSYKSAHLAMWKLWKVDGRFLSLESIGLNGYFLLVQDGKVTLGKKRELITGINTQFISGFSLDRSKEIEKPLGITEDGYGDILLNYFTPNGEDKTGYICDYDWGLPDAEAICRYFGFQSGLPTFDGKYSSTKYPDYVISGVNCEEGAESFLTCPFKSEYSSKKYFAQASMLQFHGKGYGCNRGSKTDVAGVICGNQSDIKNLLVEDLKCENSEIATNMVAKVYTFQRDFKMVTDTLSENKHWSEFILPMPMSISLTTTLLLISSQFDDDVKLLQPSAPGGFWKHLFGDSLKSNLLFLANFISDTIEQSTYKMNIITYNSMETQKYMDKVAINAFSDENYEFKKLMSRQLEYISQRVSESVEKSMEIHKSFQETGFVIKDLLFCLKMDQSQLDFLDEETKYINLLLQQWSTLTDFFLRFEGLLRVQQRNVKVMDDNYYDILLLKGSKPKESFIKRLQESNIGALGYTLFAERISRFYCKFSEDVLVQTNLNFFYLSMKKVNDEASLERFKVGLIDEAKFIQSKISKEAAKEDSLMHDKIGAKLYAIANNLQCSFNIKVEGGVL